MLSQKGVLRVNCVDCLDRTNNAMACVASVVLTEMLQSMGLDLEEFASHSTHAVTNELLELVLNMFAVGPADQANGDKIAQQYAGSDAFHKAQIYKTGEGTWQTIKQNIALIAVKRYLSNTLMDSEKQRALWLFLGEFTPEFEPKKELWDLNPEEKEADETICKNALENYVNTLQEKLRLTEGRLKRVFLKDTFSYNPHVTPDFFKYYEEDIKFDTPTILTVNSSKIDPEPAPDSPKEHKKHHKQTHPSLFKTLDDMNKFKKAEEALWSDAYSLINYKSSN